MASFTWLDLTADDRDKVRRVLDLFNEQGTVDELGLGSLRDTISNALFPGTSVLHTRLRYVLFIPWIYQELESWGAGYDVDRHAREMEIQLIYALADGLGDKPVIAHTPDQTTSLAGLTRGFSQRIERPAFPHGRADILKTRRLAALRGRRVEDSRFLGLNSSQS